MPDPPPYVRLGIMEPPNQISSNSGEQRYQEKSAYGVRKALFGP